MSMDWEWFNKMLKAVIGDPIREELFRKTVAYDELAYTAKKRFHTASKKAKKARKMSHKSRLNNAKRS